MKTAVTTPLILKRFAKFNRGKSYAKQIKPFNFLLSATVDPIDCPPQIGNAKGFHLVAPYSRNPSDWLKSSWTDLHSNNQYRIRSKGHSSPAAIRVRTFRNVLDRFRAHPEAKSADREGNPSDKKTVGLLRRLPVEVLCIFHIGKEANLLEQQEEGVLTGDPQAVYAHTSEWEQVRPLLSQVSIRELAARSGVSGRMLRALRQGDREPSPETVQAILGALGEMLGE